MARWNQFCMNQWGQSRQFLGTLPVFSKTAVFNSQLRGAQNSRVQSSASTLALYAFSSLNSALKPLGGKALAAVHDATYNSVLAKRGAEAIELVFQHLEDLPPKKFDWMDLPMKIDVEVGTNMKNAVGVKRGITQVELEHLLLEEIGCTAKAA